MKLELKHLAPYLPYGLKGIEKEYKVVQELIGLDAYGFTLEDGEYDGLERFKPILRPLSDLEKDEYKLIYEYETDFESIYSWTLLDAETRLCEKMSFELWQDLFAHHFDIFGLIDKDLAIPYENTL